MASITMTFKAKTFKLGNARAVYIPKEVYTELEDDKVYTFRVLEDKDVYTEKAMNEKGDWPKVGDKMPSKDPVDKLEHKPFDTSFCKKHQGFKGSCGCK